MIPPRVLCHFNRKYVTSMQQNALKTQFHCEFKSHILIPAVYSQNISMPHVTLMLFEKFPIHYVQYSYDCAATSKAVWLRDPLNLRDTFLPSVDSGGLLWLALSVYGCLPAVVVELPSVWRRDTGMDCSASRTHSHHVCAKDVPFTWQHTHRAWLWSSWQRDTHRD